MMLRIIPGKSRRVRDPATGQLLTKRPRDVPDTPFWRRRLADGDVEIAPDRKSAPAAAPTPAKKDQA